MSPLLAAVFAATLAVAGWRARALTGPGAAAATAVGTALLIATSWAGAGALAAFFLSTSIVSRIPAPFTRGDPKGNRRDHWQVLANGGPAAVAAWLARDQPGLALWAATSSLAAAGADTWATSVGAWSRAAPRHLLTWRRVPAGTNGGISALGSLGALAGAGIVSVTAGWLGHELRLAGVALGIGFGGMLVDSALGGSLQGSFRCPVCAEPSEWRMHRCGTRTIRVGGLAWLDNDGVNALATGVAALAGWCAWQWLASGSAP